MPTLIEADDAARRVIEQLPEQPPVALAVGDGDLALYCDERLLMVAIAQLLQAAKGEVDGVEITLTVAGEAQYVCFTVTAEQPPGEFRSAAEHLGGLVRVEAGCIALLLPSANWSPSHRH